MTPERLSARLRGGDRRSIGRANEVVKQALADPSLMAVLVDAIAGPDRLVAMRAADAAEKVSRVRPDLLAPFTERLLRDVAVSVEPELRWHAAQMLPRVVTGDDRRRARAVLLGYLADPSSIVQTFALQGLVDLADDDEASRAALLAMIDKLADTGTPAVRSRARRLGRQLRQ